MGKVLAQGTNVVFVGELAEILNRYLENKDFECECGLNSSECKFWKEVFSNLDMKIKESGLQPGITNPEFVTQYFDTLFEVSRAEVIIDSSKEINYILETLRLDKFQKQYVLIKRDIRGIVYSRKRDRIMRISENRHPSPVLGRLHLILLLKDFVKWKKFNSRLEKFFRQIQDLYFITYEKLTSDPGKYLKEIAEIIDVNLKFDIRNNNQIAVKSGHVGIANRNKNRTGLVKIEEDMRWKEGLNYLEKLLLRILLFI